MKEYIQTKIQLTHKDVCEGMAAFVVAVSISVVGAATLIVPPREVMVC